MTGRLFQADGPLLSTQPEVYSALVRAEFEGTRAPCLPPAKSSAETGDANPAADTVVSDWVVAAVDEWFSTRVGLTLGIAAVTVQEREPRVHTASSYTEPQQGYF